MAGALPPRHIATLCSASCCLCFVFSNNIHCVTRHFIWDRHQSEPADCGNVHCTCKSDHKIPFHRSRLMQKNNCGRQLVFCPDEKTAIVCHQVQLLSVSKPQPFDERWFTTRVPRWNRKTSIEQMRPFPSGVAFALQFPISTHSPPSRWIVHSESSADETWDKFPKMAFERRSALQFLIQALLGPSWWIEFLSQTRGKHGKNFTKELWNEKYMLQFPKSNSVEEFALT